MGEVTVPTRMACRRVLLLLSLLCGALGRQLDGSGAVASHRHHGRTGAAALRALRGGADAAEEEQPTSGMGFGRESVVAALAAIKRGEVVVVTDDEDRENEGDLIMAAEYATPDQIGFIMRCARGLICVSVRPRPPRTALRPHTHPWSCLLLTTPALCAVPAARGGEAPRARAAANGGQQ